MMLRLYPIADALHRRPKFDSGHILQSPPNRRQLTAKPVEYPIFTDPDSPYLLQGIFLRMNITTDGYSIRFSSQFSRDPCSLRLDSEPMLRIIYFNARSLSASFLTLDQGTRLHAKALKLGLH